MKMKLELIKAGTVMVGGDFEIADAESFGRACGEMWMRLEKRCLDKTTSVGEFMDRAGDSVARELGEAILAFREA